jgi:AraC-like DNA-binding protein
MAEGVACMIQLQRIDDRLGDSAPHPFATPGVLSYHEYLDLARIPPAEGISAKVLDALHKRNGQPALAIDQVAEDLDLSKRTLQRRLQQQGANFAQLRDSLRFHYAIKYLIDEHMSVDAVSKTLDFSDRTSFTNAFKRWTGTSPKRLRETASAR